MKKTPASNEKIRQVLNIQPQDCTVIMLINWKGKLFTLGSNKLDTCDTQLRQSLFNELAVAAHKAVLKEEGLWPPKQE